MRRSVSILHRCTFVAVCLALAGPGLACASQPNTDTERPATDVSADEQIAPGTTLGSRKKQPFEQIGEMVEAGELQAALARCDSELEKNPKATKIHFVRGMALERLGRTDEAIAAWERAHELDPFKMYIALDAIGSAYMTQNKVDEAIDYYRRAIAASDTFADAHLNLGVALLRTGDEKGAYDELTRASTLNPEDADILLQIAVLDQARGNMDAARERVAQAVAAEPKNGFARMVSGDLLIDAGDNAAGIAQYEQAVAAEPDLGDARMRLIRALRKFDRSDEAISHVDELVQRSPESAVAWSIHAQIRFEQGKVEEALENIDKALGINPRLESAHRRKIRFLIEEKRCQDARHALKSFERNGAERGAATKATAEVRACRA